MITCITWRYAASAHRCPVGGTHDAGTRVRDSGVTENRLTLVVSERVSSATHVNIDYTQQAPAQ